MVFFLSLLFLPLLQLEEGFVFLSKTDVFHVIGKLKMPTKGLCQFYVVIIAQYFK